MAERCGVPELLSIQHVTRFLQLPAANFEI
jgi:hypothetical protein